MTSSLHQVDEILAFGQPRSPICATESPSDAIAFFSVLTDLDKLIR